MLPRNEQHSKKPTIPFRVEREQLKSGSYFTSVNRWKNEQTKPSKVARQQIDILCKKIKKLKDPVGPTQGY